jgi:formylglycine-generating enzyme required for sulfatase activity
MAGFIVPLAGYGADNKDTATAQMTDSKTIHTGPDNKSVIIDLPGLPDQAIKLTMVRIEPGMFIMGAPLNERGRRDSNDWPPHQVTITKPFYMGKFEVTQAQWEAVMGSDSHRSKYRGKDKPVGKVSWSNCQEFIEKLNELRIGRFRLPTEAEWEYACRAGTTTRFSFGDALECSDTGRENCAIADPYMWWAGNNSLKGIHDVGLKRPNDWGLHDMHGNSAEWCSDIWQKPSERSSQIDPTGPPSNWLNRWWPLTNRVNRGGSIYLGRYYRGLQECRSATRHYEQAIDHHYSLGFRLAMD